MRSKRVLSLLGVILVTAFGLLTTAGYAFAAGKEKVLYTFCSVSNCTDGVSPFGPLVFDRSGNLYGTTEAGGTNSVGTVFKLTPGSKGTWKETVLYSFQNDGQDGFSPYSGVTFDEKGNLYGTTFFGGSSDECGIGVGCGIVFELTPGSHGTWTETVLYRFQNNGQDGVGPYAGLIIDKKGNLYGTTIFGGPARSGCHIGCGTVFELTQGSHGTWTETVLHSFNYWDGAYPWAGLIFDASGDLYGTTNTGNHPGNVFRLKSNADGKWSEKVLHAFNSGKGDDGYEPVTPVIFDAAGNLYGTAFNSNGGPGGTAFKLTHGTSTEEVLFSFPTSGRDGSDPQGGLVFDAKGNLYSTTETGGTYGENCDGGCGTVFELKHGTWKAEVLYKFTGGSDGGSPQTGLIVDAKGNLYGTAVNGGGGSGCSCGVVFEITP